MSIKTLTLRSAAALMLACLTSPAWAAQAVSGQNVIRFDSTNPDRLVSGQSSLDDQQTQSNSSTHYSNKRNTYNFTSMVPSGWAPGGQYGIERMTHSWASGSTNTAFVVRSNGVSTLPVICQANSTRCGQATFQSISSSCRTVEVKAGPTIKLPLGVTGAVGSVSVGWSSCTGTSSGITCPAGTNLSFNNATYGTNETRSVWRNATLTPSDGTVLKYFANATDRTNWRNACQGVGGTYREHGDPVYGTWHGTCSNVTNRVRVNLFGEYPFLLEPNYTTCRIVRTS